MKYINAKESPVQICGMLDGYCRIPAELAGKLNENVRARFDDCSGGRVRFATDSSVVLICIILSKVPGFQQFPRSTSLGIDVYIDGEFTALFTPNEDSLVIEERVYKYKSKNEVQINLPILNHVESVEIGIDDEAQIFAPLPYKITKPVVFYGSSITHGMAATRPGNTYPARLSRELVFDFVNLGFAGGCRGEIQMAEYIASLDMSLFVFDYDHNAINAPELEERHERFFKIIRKAQPELPVLMLSKLDFLNDPQNNAARRDVIYSTYSHAQADGDEMYGLLTERGSIGTIFPVTERRTGSIRPTVVLRGSAI